MIRKVITVEDWAEIRRLHRSEQMPIKAIARHIGISRNTVKRALAAQDPPKYQRRPQGSIVDPFEPQIRDLLRKVPTMPATVIAERIGWQRSMTVLKDRVRQLRPLYLPADPASRTTYQPGELAQCDLWFPNTDIPLGAGQTERPPVLVMVSGYSRWILARMLPSRQAGDLTAGMWALLSELGRTPRTLVWDNEPAVGSWRGGKPRLAQEFAALKGSLGVAVYQCLPKDPETKGMVERANGYLETSFEPGRTYTGPEDFNTQLAAWLERANNRMHSTLRCRPTERFAADLEQMVALPDRVPSAVGWWRTSRLPRDHYVRLATCDYSVHPTAVGRQVLVHADLERVRVRCGGELVADHPRCWASHQTLTDPEHARAARRMRGQARSAREPELMPEPVEQRDLDSYDRLLGVEGVA